MFSNPFYSFTRPVFSQVKRRLALALIPCLLLVLSTSPVQAYQEEVVDQPPVIVDTDASPDEVTPASDSLPVVDVDVAGEALLRFISTGILGGVITSPVVVGVVAFLKRLKALEKISSQWLAVAVGGIVYISLVVASKTGYETQLRSVFDLLLQALPVITGFFTMLMGSGAVFKVAHKLDAPIIGQTRQDVRDERNPTI